MDCIATTETDVVWKEHKDFLASGIRDLFLNEYQMDTNVTFNSDVQKAHRIILAIFLPTFKRSVDVAGGNLRELNLNCVADRTEDVRALIEFVYTGKTTVADDRLDHLRNLAEDLRFEGLANALAQCQPSHDLRLRSGAAGAEIKLEVRDSDEGCDDHLDDGDEDDDDSDKACDDHLDDEDEEDDDSEYRPRTGNKSGGHRARRAKGNMCRAKGAEDNSTEVDQEEIDRYCQSVFKGLEEGYEPQEPTWWSNDVDLNKSRRKTAAAAETQEDTGPRPKCTECRREFINDRALQRHVKVCGHSQQFACNYCDHIAVTRKLLRRHQYDAHRREMGAERRNRVNHIKCPEPLCKFACIDQLRLKLHTQRMHTADKKFKCRECEHATIRQSELTMHVNMCHLKLKNFQCDHCGTCFGTKSSLYKHVRSVHQDYKHYKCEHCEKEFRTHEAYVVHLQFKHNVDAGVEMHVCDMCGKSYNRRWNLQLHTRRVHKTSLESRAKVFAPRSNDRSQDGGSDDPRPDGTSSWPQQHNDQNELMEAMVGLAYMPDATGRAGFPLS